MSSVPHKLASSHLLIIRFSSFGDILQACAVPRGFAAAYAGAKVDWLMRSDFASLLSHDPGVDRLIPFPRSAGFGGLLRIAWLLGGEAHTHVYDAHANLRSQVVCWVIRLRRTLRSVFFRRSPARPRFLRRPKERVKRWLLFSLGIRLFPAPFRGAESFLAPLKPWGVGGTLPPGPHVFPGREPDSELDAFGPFVALAPSAAWEMKRWPPEHWHRLITLLPDLKFVLLGGPEDGFCEDVRRTAPERVVNLAGRRSLQGSLQAVARASLTIAGDTGLLHAADMMGRPTIALIGPTAFGYPSGPRSEVMEIELPCKPCSKDGRGRCRNSIYRRCLVDVEPERVALAVRRLLGQS